MTVGRLSLETGVEFVHPPQHSRALPVYPSHQSVNLELGQIRRPTHLCIFARLL
jgi:hypothetical protein